MAISDENVNISFNLVPEKQVEAAIANDYTRIDWTGRSTKNIATATGQIRESIAQGIREGQDYSQMANAVSDRMGKSAADMQRIARTEGHRARSQGNLDSLKFAHKKGLNLEKEWVAALDERTRDAHAILDGQTVGIDEEFVSSAGGRGQGPGLMGNGADDIYCRCDLVGITPGEKFEYRGYRYDDAPGSFIGKYSNYMDWAKKKGIKPHLFTDMKPAVSIGKFESSIIDQQFEIAGIFDKNGNFLTKINGDEGSIEFSKNHVDMLKGNTLTHNHPGGGTFSLSDIKSLSNYDIGEIRAVGIDGTYIATPKSPSIKSAKEIDNIFNNRYQIEKERAYDLLDSGEMTKAMVPEWKKQVVHTIWETIADEIGIIYRYYPR
jgi:SPP1 gp7 family putative phage head morphogenesis protein